jgi:hypothetical protein
MGKYGSSLNTQKHPRPLLDIMWLKSRKIYMFTDKYEEMTKKKGGESDI